MTQAPLPIGLMCPTSIWICQVEFKSPSLSFIRLWAVGRSLFSVFFKLKTSFKRDSFNTTSIFYFCFYLSQSKNLWHEWGGSKCKYFFLQTIKMMALNKPSKEVLHSWLFRNSRERECGKEIGFLTLSSTARVCKNKGEAQKYLLLFISRRSLLTVLVRRSCCQDDLFVSSPLPLRIICPLLTRRWVGGKKETKISDMYLLRPIVAKKKT